MPERVFELIAVGAFDGQLPCDVPATVSTTAGKREVGIAHLEKTEDGISVTVKLDSDARVEAIIP